MSGGLILKRRFRGDVLGRWERRFSEAADMALQVYYDYTKRREAPIGVLICHVHSFRISLGAASRRAAEARR